MKKVLYILRGIPGCGKSTVAKLLANGDVSVICTADDYFMKDGKYMFDASKLGAAHLHCQSKCDALMAKGVEKIFVANTSTTVKELNDYYKIAAKHDYMVVSMIVENRHDGKNEHSVPEEALTRMKERFDIKLI